MFVLKWCLAFIFMTTVTAALHSPYNVMMKAVNTRYNLTWDWDQTQANYTMEFTSEYTFSDMVNNTESYRTACKRTTQRHCDYSHLLFYEGSYVLRVRAEGRGESSPWSAPRRFCADEDASLGPPSRVEVQSGEATLTVVITGPLTVRNTLMSDILSLSYRVQYWEKHTPQRKDTLELKTTRAKLTSLKPQTHYCLHVCAFSPEEEKTSPYTHTQCVETGGRGLHLGWYMLLILCCGMIAVCLVFRHRGKIRSLFIRPTLPSSLQDPPPSASCRLMEPREDSYTALVLLAPQCPPEDRRAEQAAAHWQDSSEANSGFSCGGGERTVLGAARSCGVNPAEAPAHS